MVPLLLRAAGPVRYYCNPSLLVIPLPRSKKYITLLFSMGENNVSAAESDAVSAWLSKFEAALSKSDAKAAAALFADECYWRDLVSFTWNIITLEGRAAIEAMLKETLSKVKPYNWKIEREATATDGIVEMGQRLIGVEGLDIKGHTGPGHVPGSLAAEVRESGQAFGFRFANSGSQTRLAQHGIPPPTDDTVRGAMLWSDRVKDTLMLL